MVEKKHKENQTKFEKLKSELWKAEISESEELKSDSESQNDLSITKANINGFDPTLQIITLSPFSKENRKKE